jgi:hypothetical protein
MSHAEVKHILQNMGVALRANRENAAQKIFDQPHLFESLIHVSLDPEYKLHHKGAWVMEIILEKKLDWIEPFLDLYISHLKQITKESAVRAFAKINHWISHDYINNASQNTSSLSHNNILQMVETGFDWMIQQYPTAPQVYTMDMLFDFGSLKNMELEWVHENLKDLLLQNMLYGSPGYIAHGKKTLTKLTKK